MYVCVTLKSCCRNGYNKPVVTFAVDSLPPVPSQSLSMQYMIVIIVACIVVVAVVALIFVCCCCRRRNNKLKNKTADMEVSHRGVVTQQVRNLCSGFLTLYIPFIFTENNMKINMILECSDVKMDVILNIALDYFQAPPPPYYTVGLDNKGLTGSVDTGLDDPSKTPIYTSQQYHGYPHNPHPNNTHANHNGMFICLCHIDLIIYQKQ